MGWAWDYVGSAWSGLVMDWSGHRLVSAMFGQGMFWLLMGWARHGLG